MQIPFIERPTGRRSRFTFASLMWKGEALTAVCCGACFSLATALVTVAAGTFLGYLFPATAEHAGLALTAETLIGAVFLGPPIETLLFQVFVIEAVGFARRRQRAAAVLTSTVVFSSMHLFSGSIQRAVAIAALGAMLAHAYCWAREHSLSAAFMTTLATHTFHNAVIILIALAFPQLA